MPAHLPVTAVILTKNEEAVIARAVQSIKRGVTEVLVFDTGSSDKTRARATRAGARVVDDGPWAKWHFANARNKAAMEADYDWIFTLDADEVVRKGGRDICAAAAKLTAMGALCGEVRWRQEGPRSVCRATTPRLYHSTYWAYRYRVHNVLLPLVGVKDARRTLPSIEVGHLIQEDKRPARFAQTVALLEEAVKAEPEHIDAHRYLADAYIRVGDFVAAARAARAYIQKALTTREPLDISEGWCFLARALERGGDITAALTAYNTAATVAPARREPLWEAAHMLGNAKRWAEACSYLKRLLAIPLQAKPVYFPYTWDPVWSTMPAEALAAFEREAAAATAAEGS